jgi:signal transduction histidine kinase
MAAWGELLERSLPGPDASPQEQADAVRDWSQRLRLPLALDDASGQRVVASESFQRRQDEDGVRVVSVRLDDGRTLWIVRPRLRAPLQPGEPPPPNGRRGHGPLPGDVLLPFVPPNLPRGLGLALFLGVLFAAVAAGAYPVVRRLTRRLESLKRGVERFGSGRLDHRVEVSGRDEVAAVAESFNQAAARVEALVQSNKSLLANASHELRSPLARLRMAATLLGDADGAVSADPAQRAAWRAEVERNVAELDALVDEILLASRLDAGAGIASEPVDLAALLAEAGAAAGATLRVLGADGGRGVTVRGDPRLLRRLVRNLLENARRHAAAGPIEIELNDRADGPAFEVLDRGPGVPPGERERIFEPFHRLAGHGESAGGVGLGLALVRQIAHRHGATVTCLPREGGGSRFRVSFGPMPA